MKYRLSIIFLISYSCCIGQKVIHPNYSLKDTTYNKRLVSSPKNLYAKWQSFSPPAALITYGLLAQGNNSLKKLDFSTQYEIIEDHPGFSTKIDNYLQCSPVFAVYFLNAVGVKGKNNFKDRTIVLALSTIIASGFVTSIKSISHVQRPDGSSYNSFPSGHTAAAFAGAEFLRMEYKEVSPWYGITGYVVAAATGALRVYNNRHWLSDVIAGAGFGILSTKLAYIIYHPLQKKLFKNKHALGMGK